MRRTVTLPSKSAAPEDNPDIIDAVDLARYIAEMSGEMAALSRRAGWPLVTYFLEMAELQAQERLRQRGQASLSAPRAPSGRQRRTNGRR